MRKPLRPHREGPTIVGGVSEVILTVLYNEKREGDPKVRITL